MTKAKWLATLAIILAGILLALIWKRSEERVAEALPEPSASAEELVHVVTREKAKQPSEALNEPEAAPEPSVPDEDTILLAKIMQEEDGVYWPDAMIMCIGEVVMNRVASPEFPNSIHDVIYQTEPLQYAPITHESWEGLHPDEHYIELALRLQDGERVMDDPQVVYQALFPQGGGTVLTYTDMVLGSTTYFCLTDMPGLYGGGANG